MSKPETTLYDDRLLLQPVTKYIETITFCKSPITPTLHFRIFVTGCMSLKKFIEKGHLTPCYISKKILSV